MPRAPQFNETQILTATGPLIARHVETELRGFTGRLCGRQDARRLRSVAYAVVEAPFAAVRRHVAARESPPSYVDTLIRITYEAVIHQLGVATTERSAP